MPTISIPITSERGPVVRVRLGHHDPNQKGRYANALLDTGAEQSFIDETLAADLGMQPQGRKAIETPSGGSDQVETEGRLTFPHDRVELEVPGIRFLVTDLQSQGLQVIIGRDVLRHVLVFWDGPGETVALSF